jgi:DNA-directed RNA polymerase subunit K/omega
MSTLKTKDPKHYQDSEDEDEAVDNEPGGMAGEYDDDVDESDSELDVDEGNEIEDDVLIHDDLGDENDDYTTIAGPVPQEAEDQEPADLEMLSLMVNTEEESLLVSNDTLSIHTSPYLTKYEMTKVLALRAQQIATGAPPTVEASDFPENCYPMDPYTIAVMELKKSRLPLIIGRRLPNNTIIRIPVHALLIPE